jgi:hypothetical protein
VRWRVAYSAVILPLARTMINCSYNISAIFENPGEMGYLFRASGYRRTLGSLDADKRRYGGDARWEDYLLQRRKLIDFDMRTNGFTKGRSGDKALAPGKGASPAPHQQFLRAFYVRFLAGILCYLARYVPRAVAHRALPCTQGFAA